MLLPHPARTMAGTAISSSAVLTAVGVGNTSLLYVDVLVHMYKFKNIQYYVRRAVQQCLGGIAENYHFSFSLIRTRLLKNLVGNRFIRKGHF